MKQPLKMKMTPVLFGCLCYLLTLGQGYAQQSTTQYTHPLDPLDSNEIKLVKQVLLKEGKVRDDSSSLYSIINLQEPPKEEVLAYQPGQPFTREAYAYVYDYPNNALAKAVI